MGDASIEINDYKISTSMHGNTEVEIMVTVPSTDFSEFELKATKELFQTRRLTTTNGAP